MVTKHSQIVSGLLNEPNSVFIVYEYPKLIS